jgi:hypothetical protein
MDADIRIASASLYGHEDDDGSLEHVKNLADQGHDNDDNDPGDNLNMAAQAATTTEEITGTSSEDTATNEKSGSDADAKVLANNETKDEVSADNAAGGIAVVDGVREQKTLLYGPAISSLQVPPQKEIDDDINPSRPAMGMGGISRNEDTILSRSTMGLSSPSGERRSVSADGRDVWMQQATIFGPHHILELEEQHDVVSSFPYPLRGCGI